MNINRQNTVKNYKAFTLIELVVVVFIILSLTSLAMPSFINQSDKIIIREALDNIVALEKAIRVYEFEESVFPNLNDVAYSDKDINKYAKIILDANGNQVKLDPSANYYDIDYIALNNLVKIQNRDKANFIVKDSGLVYYLKDINQIGAERTDFTKTNKTDNDCDFGCGDEDNKDHGKPKPEKPYTPTKYLASDKDFSGREDGRFRYIGEEKIVEIPLEIKGVPITSYKNMFKDKEGIRKVISKNPNITDTSYMFYDYESRALDLSDFDTSNVVIMDYMFKESEFKYLNLSGFDTNKVISVKGMFYESELTDLDLKGFDTTNIEDTSSMFKDAEMRVLDLSSFNMETVKNTSNMFTDFEANNGFARTQKEADFFNKLIGYRIFMIK